MKIEIRLVVTGAAGEILVSKSTESPSADESEQCDTAMSDLSSDFESLVGGIHALFNTALVKYRPRWDKWKVAYDAAEAEKAAKLAEIKARKAKADELAKKQETDAAAARAEAAKALPTWRGLPDPVPNWPESTETATAPTAAADTPQ